MSAGWEGQSWLCEQAVPIGIVLGTVNWVTAMTSAGETRQKIWEDFPVLFSLKGGVSRRDSLVSRGVPGKHRGRVVCLETSCAQAARLPVVETRVLGQAGLAVDRRGFRP